jgi:predicted nucleic acid-binding Zn ribbon protein
MHGKTISQLYFYLISALSLIFIIIGIYNAVTFGVNMSQFEKYPLQFGGDDRCAYNMPHPPGVDPKTQVSPEDQKKQNEICLNQLELERKQHKVNDIKNAITFTLIGIILFSIHFPTALKRSKN